MGERVPGSIGRASNVRGVRVSTFVLLRFRARLLGMTIPFESIEEAPYSKQKLKDGTAGARLRRFAERRQSSRFHHRQMRRQGSTEQ